MEGAHHMQMSRVRKLALRGRSLVTGQQPRHEAWQASCCLMRLGRLPGQVLSINVSTC